jgi:Tol biopolymer transport system component
LGSIAFVRNGNIWVKNLDTDEERQLTSDGNNIRPRWSPDGQWLLFQKTMPVDGGFTQVSLWTMRNDGSGATEIDAGQTYPPVWSPRENRLAYATAGGLWLVSADGSNRLEVLPPSGSPDIRTVAWSPDGQRVIFERWQRTQAATPTPSTIEGQGLWVVNRDGTGLAELYSAWDPATVKDTVDIGVWSPDGRWIAVWQGSPDPTARSAGLPVFVIPATGGSAQQLASAALPRDTFLAWSPAGDRIAIVEGAGPETWADKNIVVASADGSERQAISDESVADLAPAWSPDGGQIAFVSEPATEPGQAEQDYPALVQIRRIWIMNSDGTDKLQLTSDPNYGDEFPQWSANGQHILFVRQQAATIGATAPATPESQAAAAEVWLMNADGSDQRKLADGLSGGGVGYYGYLDWGQWLDWYR